MHIGVLNEIKDNEFRVGLMPDNVRTLKNKGHTILVERGAGEGIAATDEDYRSAGADIATDPLEIFSKSELIIKVKELQSSERMHLRAGQILFAFLHLAPDPEQAQALLNAKVTAFGYETVMDNAGRLPLLMPMSEIAGRVSIPSAAKALEKIHGGKGLLLGRVPGLAPARVLILGGGTAGTAALRSALGLGAEVIVLDHSLARLRELSSLFDNQIEALYFSKETLIQLLPTIDVIVGTILIAGKKAAKLITRSMLPYLKPGSVLVDIAIDQGGCFETSRPTTHSHPTYVEEGIVHYCVTNIPGIVPLTSTPALTNATLPYILELADKGVQKACLDNPALMKGLNAYNGNITHPAVAKALNMPYKSVNDLFSLI